MRTTWFFMPPWTGEAWRGHGEVVKQRRLSRILHSALTAVPSWAAYTSLDGIRPPRCADRRRRNEYPRARVAAPEAGTAQPGRGDRRTGRPGVGPGTALRSRHPR